VASDDREASGSSGGPGAQQPDSLPVAPTATAPGLWRLCRAAGNKWLMMTALCESRRIDNLKQHVQKSCASEAALIRWLPKQLHRATSPDRSRTIGGCRRVNTRKFLSGKGVLELSHRHCSLAGTHSGGEGYFVVGWVENFWRWDRRGRSCWHGWHAGSGRSGRADRLGVVSVAAAFFCSPPGLT